MLSYHHIQCSCFLNNSVIKSEKKSDALPVLLCRQKQKCVCRTIAQCSSGFCPLKDRTNCNNNQHTPTIVKFTAPFLLLTLSTLRKMIVLPIETFNLSMGLKCFAYIPALNIGPQIISAVCCCVLKCIHIISGVKAYHTVNGLIAPAIARLHVFFTPSYYMYHISNNTRSPPQC